MHGQSEKCREVFLVQRFLSNSAYENVKFVAENMHLIKFMFSYLEHNDILMCVRTDLEIQQFDPTVTGFLRKYAEGLNGKMGYVDYIYDATFSGGIKPLNQEFKGSWLPVNSSFTDTNHPAFGPRIWVYNKGQSLGGETKVFVDVQAAGIKCGYLNGSRIYLNDDFTYDPITQYVTLTKRALGKGEHLSFDIVGIPAIPGNEDESIDGYTMRNWLYNEKNGGRAIGDGSEKIIRIDVNYLHITDIIHNGKRLVHELNLECKVLPNRGGIELTKPLEKGDTLIVKIGGFFGNRP